MDGPGTPDGTLEGLPEEDVYELEIVPRPA